MGKRLIAVGVIAAAMAAAGAGAASAGEVTGNCNNAPDGSAAAANCKKEFSQGASICKFSGQNDKPDSTDPMDPGGRVQSYGYSVVREGGKAFAPSPGFACNPNNGFGE